MLLRSLLAGPLVLVSIDVLAQSGHQEEWARPCDTASTVIEARACFCREFARADSLLRATYDTIGVSLRDMLDRLRLADRPDTAEIAWTQDLLDALQRSQQAWLASREADRSIVAVQWQGGSGRIGAECHDAAAATYHRLHRLRALLDQ